MRYRADITAGALKLAESRVVADLLIRGIDGQDVWRNVLRGVEQGDSWASLRSQWAVPLLSRMAGLIVIVPEPVTHRTPIHAHQHRSPTPTRLPMAAG